MLHTGVKSSSLYFRVSSIRQLTLTPYHTWETKLQSCLSSCFNHKLSCNEILWQETFQAVSLPTFVLRYWWDAQGWLLLRALYQWRRASLDTCISFEICGVCFMWDLELSCIWPTGLIDHNYDYMYLKSVYGKTFEWVNFQSYYMKQFTKFHDRQSFITFSTQIWQI